MLADIFRGTIKNWNDPAIAALNPGVKLPSDRDHAGLPLGFLGHHRGLHQLPGRGRRRVQAEVGAGKTVNWPTGVGGKGNAGVAANVQKIGGSIGYVEYAYAKQNKMTYAAMVNKAGKIVQPDDLPFAAAADRRRLVQGARLRHQPEQPAGRECLADHLGHLSS